MRIYVASSWRNSHQPHVVAALRDASHEVYDFRNPAPDATGFDWSKVDPRWRSWSLEDFRRGLRSDEARRGFEHDLRGLQWCDACVLVLPSGRSAHLEAGWCSGRGKRVLVYSPKFDEPDLMYLLFATDRLRLPIYGQIEELLSDLRQDTP
jgi:hypothetical protein